MPIIHPSQTKKYPKENSIRGGIGRIDIKHPQFKTSRITKGNIKHQHHDHNESY